MPKITQKAWFDGHQAAVILVSDSDYGKRLENLFQEKWQALGGLIIPAEPLAESQDAIKAQLSDLMHVRISKLRIERLQQLLGVPLSAPNRNRSDVGCIFLAVPETIARQVGPQMRFLDLDDISKYTQCRTSIAAIPAGRRRWTWTSFNSLPCPGCWIQTLLAATTSRHWNKRSGRRNYLPSVLMPTK